MNRIFTLNNRFDTIGYKQKRMKSPSSRLSIYCFLAILTLCQILACHQLSAQTNNVGIGTITPDNSSILELLSTSRGFLVPRMTTVQRGGIVNPATSLMIFNTTTGTYQYNSGTPLVPNWLDVVAGPVGQTLNQSYNQGGAGAGRTITANAGAVIINASNAADWALKATQTLNGGGLFVENQGTGISFQVNDVAADATPFVIDDAGRVGIGTSAPSATVSLDVAGNTRITGNLEVTGIIDPLALVLLPQGGAPTAQKGKMYFDGGVNKIKCFDGTSWQTVQTGTSSITGAGTTGQVTFWTGASTLSGSNNLYWDNTLSRLGIGVSPPIRTLDVNGNIGLAASSYINFGATDGLAGYGFRDNAGSIEFKNSGGAWAAFGSGGGNTLNGSYNQGGSGAGRTITVNSGAVSLVGSNAADWTLSASSNAAGGVFLITNTGAGLSMRVDDNAVTSPFVIDPSGKVGVGLLLPTTKLHVYHSSASKLPEINIEQAGSGDASLKFTLTAGQNAVIGIDNADNDNIKISNTTGLTGTTYSDANTMLRIHTETNNEGIVDINHQSRARAYLSTAAQSIGDASWAKVFFDAENFDEKSEHSGGTFTAKAEGYYQVNARTEFDLSSASTPGSYMTIAIYVNGSLYSLGNQLIAQDATDLFTFNNAPVVSDVVYVQSGQTVEIWVFQNTGASRNINNGTAKTYFSIHKIS